MTASVAVSRETVGSSRRLLRGRAAIVSALLLSALFLAGCTGIASPEGWAGPVAADGTFFVSLERGKLSAIDQETGQARWTFPGNSKEEKELKLKAIYGTPVVSGNRIYFGAYDGAAYAQDAETGALVWRTETGGPIAGGPALADGTIYVGSLDGKAYALNAETGKASWPTPFNAGAEIYAQPVVQGDVVYVATMGGRLFALDAASGEPRWTFEADAGLPAAPALVEGRLYIGSLDNHLYAVDAADGHLLWSFKAGNWFWTTPLVQDGIVYAAALDHKVYALDAETGQTRWQKPFPTEDSVRATPALVADVLLVADRAGNVYGLRPDTGDQVWSSALDAGVLANPLVMDGSVYFSLRNGHLERVDPAKGDHTTLVPSPPLTPPTATPSSSARAPLAEVTG